MGRKLAAAAGGWMRSMLAMHDVNPEAATRCAIYISILYPRHAPRIKRTHRALCGGLAPVDGSAALLHRLLRCWPRLRPRRLRGRLAGRGSSHAAGRLAAICLHGAAPTCTGGKWGCVAGSQAAAAGRRPAAEGASGAGKWDGGACWGVQTAVWPRQLAGVGAQSTGTLDGALTPLGTHLRAWLQPAGLLQAAKAAAPLLCALERRPAATPPCNELS